MDENKLNRGRWPIEHLITSGIEAKRKLAEEEIADYDMPKARKNLADFDNVLWCVRNLKKNYADEKNIVEACRLISIVYRWNLTHWRAGTQYWRSI